MTQPTTCGFPWPWVLVGFWAGLSETQEPASRPLPSHLHRTCVPLVLKAHHHFAGESERGRRPSAGPLTPGVPEATLCVSPLSGWHCSLVRALDQRPPLLPSPSLWESRRGPARGLFLRRAGVRPRGPPAPGLRHHWARWPGAEPTGRDRRAHRSMGAPSSARHLLLFALLSS